MEKKIVQFEVDIRSQFQKWALVPEWNSWFQSSERDIHIALGVENHQFGYTVTMKMKVIFGSFFFFRILYLITLPEKWIKICHFALFLLWELILQIINLIHQPRRPKFWKLEKFYHEIFSKARIKDHYFKFSGKAIYLSWVDH